MTTKITRCAKCGRKLTNPESIAAGLGPECRGASSAKPLKNWGRKVRNTARIRCGLSFSIGPKDHRLTINQDNYEKNKWYLIRYGFIMKDCETVNPDLMKAIANGELLPAEGEVRGAK